MAPANQNPKSEARNPKLTETLEFEKRNPRRARLEFVFFHHLDSFRIWDFELQFLLISRCVFAGVVDRQSDGAGLAVTGAKAERKRKTMGKDVVTAGSNFKTWRQ